MNNLTAEGARVLDLIHLGAVEHPGDVVEEIPGVNHRYARELLGMLVTDGLAEVVDNPQGGADMWRLTQEGANLAQERRRMVELKKHTGHTPKETPMASTKTRKSTKTTRKPTTVPNDGGNRVCGCGCGAIVAGKSVFRQGHDARMVSQLVAAVIGGGSSKAAAIVPPAFSEQDTKTVTGSEDIQHRIDVATASVAAYFGDRLADKAHNAMMNGWAKYDKPEPTRKAGKAAKAPKVVQAKVGRWTKEGHLTAEGDLVTTDAKGREQIVEAGKFKLIG